MVVLEQLASVFCPFRASVTPIIYLESIHEVNTNSFEFIAKAK
jgi:hypothetical protein